MRDKKYSFLIGLSKTAKNSLILLTPAIIAALTNLPEAWRTKYAWIIGCLIYLLKNYIENRTE